MKYNLSTFQGRLQAIAAGETLRNKYDTLRLVHDTLVDVERRYVYTSWNVLSRDADWSLAPKPEKTVTITRKQFVAAVRTLYDGAAFYPLVMEELAKELGLGEDET